MRRSEQSDSSIHAAALSAAALIAHQVGGKATRDAFFLSNFDVAALSWMVLAASVLSIIAGIAGARLLASMSPRRVVPRAFMASAALLLIEWGVSYSHPRIAAVLVYLQVAAIGAGLISAFWTLLGDRFDPHTARRQFGRIIAASTFGGIVGGLIAERVGTVFGVTWMFPVLAALDLVCAFLTSNVGSAPEVPEQAHKKAGDRRPSLQPLRYGAVRVLRDEPYLRHLALLIVFSTAGAGLLDYVFKARAVAAHSGGAELVRFFAVFYTAVGLITFAVQSGLSRFSLEKFGLARTIGSMPFVLAIGSVTGLVFPGIVTAGAIRGSEAVLRSSLFRSGYELFYAAVPSRKRRETKPILDVGFERAGDMLGGMLISILLLAGSGAAIPLMLAIAAITGLAGMWISRMLHQGYVKALETNLLNQSIHIPISDIRDSTTRAAVMRTLQGRTPAPSPQERPKPPASIVERPKPADALVDRIVDLRSSDPEVVRRALQKPLEPVLAAHAIGLLAWNAVADDAVTALQKVAPSIIGLLTDALLDPSQEFAVRRRIPRILAVTDSKRAFEGLTHSLSDNRFEVRFQSGRALAQIQDRVPEIPVDQALITKAVLQELLVDREVWESRRVIDAGEDEPVSVSSEHVFRLLSLILPREPMRIAYRGLHSGNEHLKGMALEYFDSVLPAEVRRPMRPLLETA